MKKYFHYLLLFIAIYIIVTILTNFGMRNIEKNLQYNIEGNENIEISVEEAKTSNTNGYIILSVKNKTEKLQNDKYLKVALYDNESYVITKYKEIKYLNVGETNKFTINFENSNINKAVISITEEIPKENSEGNTAQKLYNKIIDTDLQNDDMTKSIAVPIGILLGLSVILP